MSPSKATGNSRASRTRATSKPISLPADAARQDSAQDRDVLEAMMKATDVLLVYLDRDFNFVAVNPAYAEAAKMRAEDLIGKNHFAIYPHAENEEIFRRVRNTGEPAFYKDKPFEYPDQPERGMTYWDWSLVPVKDRQGAVTGLVYSLRETTRYKRAEEDHRQADLYQHLSAEVLGILNETGDFRESLRRVLTAMREQTGCDAVGIRLRSEDDFPYLVQEGFSAAFLARENVLAARMPDGSVCRDAAGNARLECSCGLVLSGKTDATNPLLTSGGSFWTNDSFPLLDLPADKDPRFRPRNTCMHEGYRSLALVPIRTKREIVGLLQLTGRRKGCFTIAAIRSLESIATHIGEALMRTEAEKALRQSERRFRLLVENAPDAIFVQTQRCFAYLNAQAVKLFGAASADELLGRPVLDRLHPDFRTHIEKRIRLLNEEKASVPRLEEKYLKLDGTVFDAEVSAVPIQYGEHDGALVFVRDVTARKKAEQEILKQQETIRALSTPVLAANEGLLIIPLIGSIDGQRARQLTEQALQGVRSHRARVVVIDITGVATIDTAAANHLIQTAEAARLLGAQVIVTGVSRDIALTLVTLGVDLESIRTKVDLWSGIEEGHRLLGLELRPIAVSNAEAKRPLRAPASTK